MADILVLRGAEALRRVSFHNNDRRRFRRRTLSDMAEPGTLPATTPPRSPMQPAKMASDDLLTDSEAVLTPSGGSSAGSPAKPGNDTTGSSPQLGPEHHHDDDDDHHDDDDHDDDHDRESALVDTPMLGPTLTATSSAPTSPQHGATRHASFSASSSYQEDWDIPLDRLTMLDLLDNFALPQQLEKISKGISAQTRKLKQSRDAIKTRGQEARERMVEEWRHRVPSAEEQLDRYRKRMRTSVEKLGRRWNDTKAITMREKVAFIFGVLNIFASGYLMGGLPEYMHLWYTVQILYFMPIRFYTYQRRGYHYFLADLCYFANLLLVLSLWVFPGSKRLFVACYCLAFGNNAVAIIMWRNSLVFHSFDKVTSLFIHVMPCATLHCIVHLLSPELQAARFPAVYAIRTAAPGSENAYNRVMSMLAWSSIPYAVWQLSYYFFITVRRREKIKAGRPTSFTWLRQSYSKTWIGKIVLALPGALQEPAFMLIQYLYAVCTMLPCPLWFSYRWLSSLFLFSVFTWSIYNGATYYIDVFGKRFQKELEAMRQEVAKWHAEAGKAASADGSHSNLTSPPMDPQSETDDEQHTASARHGLDKIPLLDQSLDQSPGTADASVTGADYDPSTKDGVRKRH